MEIHICITKYVCIHADTHTYILMYKTSYGLGPHLHLPTAAVEIKLDSTQSVVLRDHNQAQISITGSHSLSVFIVANQIKQIQYKSVLSQLKHSPIKISVTLIKQN